MTVTDTWIEVLFRGYLVLSYTFHHNFKHMSTLE